jgi:hypothetical protein
MLSIIITQIAKSTQSDSITQIPLLSCSIPFQNKITLISLLSLGITLMSRHDTNHHKKTVYDTDDSSKFAITFKITIQK